MYKGKSENANINRENGNLEQQKNCFFLMPQGLFQVIISNGFEMTRFLKIVWSGVGQVIKAIHSNKLMLRKKMYSTNIEKKTHKNIKGVS